MLVAGSSDPFDKELAVTEYRVDIAFQLPWSVYTLWASVMDYKPSTVTDAQKNVEHLFCLPAVFPAVASRSMANSVLCVL